MADKTDARDWRDELRERLRAKLGDHDLAAINAAIDAFFLQVRSLVGQFLLRGSSDLLTRALAAPAVGMAYLAMLRLLGLEPQPPSPQLIHSLIDRAVHEFRSRGAA